MILITGCCGFIGFHLSQFYLKKGIKIIGIDNLNNYYDTRFKKNRLKILRKNKDFKFYKIDLKNKNSLKKIKKYKKIKHIFHLAGQAGVRYSIINPQTYVSDNISAYINLLEFFKKSKQLKCIFYASSSSVYGQQKRNKKENMISVYAVSKKTLEHLSNVYNYIYKMNFIGMRFFTVYGPYGRPDMSIFKFFKNMSINKHIDVYNYGNHQRSFTYISDLIENINRILFYYKNKKNFSIIHNIGNPKSISLRTLIKIIERQLGKKTKKKLLPLQTGDVVKTIANVKKEQSKMGFKFKIDIQEGIRRFAIWFKNEN
jgi:UDP-glucuronate 4-epimerase